LTLSSTAQVHGPGCEERKVDAIRHELGIRDTTQEKSDPIYNPHRPRVREQEARFDERDRISRSSSTATACSYAHLPGAMASCPTSTCVTKASANLLVCRKDARRRPIPCVARQHDVLRGSGQGRRRRRGPYLCKRNEALDQLNMGRVPSEGPARRGFGESKTAVPRRGDGGACCAAASRVYSQLYEDDVIGRSRPSASANAAFNQSQLAY